MLARNINFSFKFKWVTAMNREINIGDKATLSKTFSEIEVENFSKISLDDNPIHLNSEYAKNTVFGKPIVHGILVASLFSGLMGGKFPGHGTVYLGQTLTFKAPVYIDEEVEASVEVVKIRADKPIVTLKTQCVKSDGTIALEGEAVVKIS
jgi:acyl dehydratase